MKKEDVLEFGNDLINVILSKFIGQKSFIPMFYEKDVRQKKEDQIRFGIEVVKKIKPSLNFEVIRIYEKGRARRSFDSEYNSLRAKANVCYINYHFKSLDSGIKSLLTDQKNKSVHDDFIKIIITEIEDFALPLLESCHNSGDDLYLLINKLMLNTTKEDAIDKIAESGFTPPETIYSVFCIFGLLVQAKRYKNQGDLDQAYSCLLDASTLIGMFDGSDYAMKHFPEVAAKMRAKVNSEKSRSRSNGIQLKAIKFFYELRPKNKDGSPKYWKSANIASNAVLEALNDEAFRDGKDALEISERTILSLCQYLHRLDKAGHSLDIRVEAAPVNVTDVENPD